MCHCIVFRINPRVMKYYASRFIARHSQLDLQDNRGIYLFTLNSTFQRGNTTLVSDDLDFINKAEKGKCVINPTGGIVQKEIGYASSRYRL